MVRASVLVAMLVACASSGRARALLPRDVEHPLLRVLDVGQDRELRYGDRVVRIARLSSRPSAFLIRNALTSDEVRDSKSKSSGRNVSL